MNFKRWVLALIPLGIVAWLGLQGLSWFQFAYSPSNPGSKETAVLLVGRGQNQNEITRFLSSKGIITDSKKFIWLGKIFRRWKHVKAGEYEFSPSMTPLEVFNTLTSGISIQYPVTVREGENMFEIAGDLEAKGLTTKAKVLELCKSPRFMETVGFKAPLPPSLEGYLFPDTYNFNRTMQPEDMLKQMIKRFHANWSAEEGNKARAMNMTRDEIITLASIIEKETGAPQERPIISAVFHNRLKKKMKLQSDPTTIYGIWEHYTGNLHKSDLLTANPYNTYYIPALPAGPISNPGKASIQAALNPSETDYLFFVSQNNGTHRFSVRFEDHAKAVNEFQVNAKAREGKSWRDLSRKLGTNRASHPNQKQKKKMR